MNKHIGTKEDTKVDALKPFLTADKIAAINKDLASRIQKDLAPLVSEQNPLLVVVTLKGAMHFAADLTRLLDLPLEIDFVRLASYGSGTRSSGTVRFLKDLETPAKGRHLLVLDEIVDSGRTLQFLKNHLSAASPASLKLAGLLNKPSRREVEIAVDYLGQDVEDKFLVGYGLDKAEQYRNLKDIFYIEQ